PTRPPRHGGSFSPELASLTPSWRGAKNGRIRGTRDPAYRFFGRHAHLREGRSLCQKVLVRPVASRPKSSLLAASSFVRWQRDATSWSAPVRARLSSASSLERASPSHAAARSQRQPFKPGRAAQP